MVPIKLTDYVQSTIYDNVYYINNNSHSVCGKSTKRDGAELRLFLGGEKKLGITRLCVWDYYIDCANISVL